MPTSAVLLEKYFSRWRLRQLHGLELDVREYLAAATGWDFIRQFNDFTGPTIDSTMWTVGNGTGAGAASPAIDVGLANGQAKFVTGTANDGTASSTLAGGRHYLGDNLAIIQARLNINTAVTNIKVEVGFRDAVGTASGAQVVNVMATPTFTATDGAVWCYDTNNTGVGWEGLAVQNGTAATTDTGYNIVPVAGTFETLQVALVGAVAYFSHFNADGKRDYGPKAVTAAVTSSVLLSPHITVIARSATSKTVDVDYILAYQQRTSTP